MSCGAGVKGLVWWRCLFFPVQRPERGDMTVSSVWCLLLCLHEDDDLWQFRSVFNREKVVPACDAVHEDWLNNWLVDSFAYIKTLKFPQSWHQIWRHGGNTMFPTHWFSVRPPVVQKVEPRLTVSGCHSCLLNSKLFNSASLSVSCYVKYVPHPTGTNSYIMSNNKSDPSDGTIRWNYFNYHLIVYLIIIYRNWRSDMWDLVAFISVEKDFYQNPPHLVSPFVTVKSTEDPL